MSQQKPLHWLKKSALILLGALLMGFLVPEPLTIPVQGASTKDWHPQSFWFEPWGSSGVHKGIDIFAPKGRPVLSTTYGLVVYTGQIAKGGTVALVLGPKWRLHYYAHLASLNTHALQWVGKGSPIGTVGDTGNAKGKPPHLHYSIVRLIPAPWAIDFSTQGHKKAFFINPSQYLNPNP